MAEEKVSCVQPAKGLVGQADKATVPGPTSILKEEIRMVAKVGKPAPDFEASAFVDVALCHSHRRRKPIVAHRGDK